MANWVINACKPGWLHLQVGATMTEDREQMPDQGHTRQDNINNKMDSLLPAPDSPSGHEPHQDRTDGTMDEVLPSPGRVKNTDDDASTREELEVDTSADGVDDFIPLNAQKRNEGPTDPKAEPEDAPAAQPQDERTTEKCPVCGRATDTSRYCPDCGTEQVAASRLLARIAPIFMWSRPLSIRVTLSIGAVLTLLALLADSGTTAFIISASTLPVVLLIHLASQLGGRSRQGWIQSSVMVLVGIAAGLPIAWIGTRMVKQSWFDGGVLHFGSVNFGGVAVETVGTAPLQVWLTNGLLLPLVLIVTISAVPAAVRIALDTPTRESTGMMLTACVAAGYVISSAIVFYWPLYDQLPPVMSTSEWTLTVVGVAVIRPLVWVCSGVMMGAVVWRYLRTASLPDVVVPGVIAVAIPLTYSLMSLGAAPLGLWTSSVAGVLFATAAVSLYQRTLLMSNEPEG